MPDKLTELQLLFKVFDAIKTLKFAEAQLDPDRYPTLASTLGVFDIPLLEDLCEAAIRGAMNVPDPRQETPTRYEEAYLEDCMRKQAERMGRSIEWST
jgi:hypothetical protein